MPSNHPFKPRKAAKPSAKPKPKDINELPDESSDESGSDGVVPGGGDPITPTDEKPKKAKKKKSD